MQECSTKGADDAVKEMVAAQLQFARAHLDVIKKWGRFPHRNAILGRDTQRSSRGWQMVAYRGFDVGRHVICWIKLCIHCSTHQTALPIPASNYPRSTHPVRDFTA